jgi:hypothetical protein
MLKWMFVIYFLISFTVFVRGQNIGEQYCEIQSYQVSFEKYLHISISFGDDSSMLDSSGNVQIIHFLKKVRSNVDMLNYMSSQGWTLVSLSALHGVIGPTYLFYLKKQIGSGK